MKPGLIAAFSVVGVGIWIFAVIGAFSVADTIAGDEANNPAPPVSLLPPGAELGGPDISLPHPPDASRTDFWRELQGDLVITRAEYVVEADPAAVRAHYSAILERDGWELLDPDLVRGEWTYVATAGQRRAAIGVEVEGRFTAITVEVSEPGARDDLSDR
ncbi:MAG: hypothetical protein ACRDGV_12030 [Candidatus Limnocylindria bacterium]